MQSSPSLQHNDFIKLQCTSVEAPVFGYLDV